MNSHTCEETEALTTFLRENKVIVSIPPSCIVSMPNCVQYGKPKEDNLGDMSCVQNF